MITPIRLVCNKSQMDFLDEISNRSLKRMTKNKHSLDIIAMKWVLGRDYVEYKDKYRVNIDICSHFVMSLLDIQVPKPMILHLTLEIFLKCYLGGLGEVVANVVYGLGLPTTSDLRKHIEEDAVVPWVPFLSGFHLLSDE